MFAHAQLCVNKIMATGSAGTCSSGLSAEQLKRIEENRHRAREKLASKKQQDQSSTVQQQRLVPVHPSAPEHHSTLLQAPSHSTAICSRERSEKNYVGNPHPQNSIICHNLSSTTQSQSSQKMTKHRSQHIPTDGRLKYTELVRPTIKANLILVSKQRFKVVVPYDKLAIVMFKKTPSNAYDPKTSTWSFGIEVYNKLVTSLQRECQYIELNQIPRSVVSLFQSLSSSHSRPLHSCPKNGSWNGVGSKLSSTLMQFQREGVDFCIGCGGRALLADDMGLGKTLQALAIMSHYRSNWPLLIICPSSVRMTWAEACQHWVSPLRENDVSVILTGKLPTTSSPITIISYDLATRLVTELAQRSPDAIIVDESHFLKNYKTNRCKAILPLVKSATRCLLLSGTPALSRPIELYTQISSLDKTFRMTRVNFGIRYCSAVKNHFGWDFSGASNLSELHLYMQERFMIRRLKNDVLDQLPSKRRQTVLLDPSMTRTHSREVCELRKELEKAGMLKAMDRRSALLPLFEKTGRLKLPAVRGYILDLLEGGRKLIVFGHHKSVLDSICECLHTKGYEHIRIDGRTPVESRQLLCDRFQHDDSCLVAVLSITTANAGLTLTASSTVVFAELFWNPGILVQAEDRVYRIGQKNSVNIHYLVARETVDDFIWPLIQNKLTVLNKAGLAVDDFSGTESTVLKSSETQQDLLGFFAEAVTELGVEETDDNTVAVDEGSSGGTGSGENIGPLEGPKKNKKRARVTVEPLTEDDPEFKPQKQKLSHKKACTVSPWKNECVTKQRTLTAMCGSSVTEGVSRERHTCIETGGATIQSKASDLASYLLSQHSIASGGTVASSQCETGMKAASVGTEVAEPTSSDAVDVIITGTCGHKITVTSGTYDPVDSPGSCQYTWTQSQSTGDSCHTMSTDCTHAEIDEPHVQTGVSGGWDRDSGCDGQWLDGLNCDLSSFDDFDDDNDTFT